MLQVEIVGEFLINFPRDFQSFVFTKINTLETSKRWIEDGVDRTSRPMHKQRIGQKINREPSLTGKQESALNEKRMWQY